MISPALSLVCALLAPQTATQVPYVSHEGLIIVDATINGDRKVKAIVDTGAGTSVLDEDLVSELKLALGESVVANGTGGNTNVSWVKGAKVSGLGVEAELKAIRVPFKPIAKMIGIPIEVVLGYDYLGTRSFLVQPDSKSLVFYEGAFPGSTDGSSEIPFKVVGGRPQVHVSVTLADGRKIKADVVLDTGSTAGLTLGGKTARENKVQAIPGRFKSQGGVGGITKIAFADVKDVTLGNFPLGKLDVDMPAEVGPKADSREGLLGMVALKGLRFAVDYPKHRILIWLKRALE